MNNLELKNVLDLSDEDILSSSEENATATRNILAQVIERYQSELNNHSRVLSDVTQRTALLMTIAGLLAFLPSIADFGELYLRHFLIWTFPFLITALCLYVPSSVRMSAIIKGMPIYLDSSRQNIITMRNLGTALETFWKKSVDIYNQSLQYFSYTSTSIYLYLISFTINLYLFTFVGQPPIIISLLLLSALLLLGAAKILKFRENSQKNIPFGQSTSPENSKV